MAENVSIRRESERQSSDVADEKASAAPPNRTGAQGRFRTPPFDTTHRYGNFPVRGPEARRRVHVTANVMVYGTSQPIDIVVTLATPGPPELRLHYRFPVSARTNHRRQNEIRTTFFHLPRTNVVIPAGVYYVEFSVWPRSSEINVVIEGRISVH